MSKYFFFTLLILSLWSAVGFSQVMPCPDGHNNYPYAPVAEPVLSDQPSSAKPIGVGPVATGGQQLRLHISLYGFSAPVDIYFGLYAPVYFPSILILQPDGGYGPVETDFNPWKSAVTGAVDQCLLEINSLLPGRYTFYLLATAPPGAFSFYYFWSTSVEISESGLVWTGCPEHGILHGTLYVHIDEGSVASYSTVHTAEIGMPFHVDCDNPIEPGKYNIIGEGGGSAKKTGTLLFPCPITVDGMLYVKNLRGTFSVDQQRNGNFYFLYDINDPDTRTNCVGMTFTGTDDEWWETDLMLPAQNGAQTSTGILSYRLWLGATD
ncbi:MAG TPA: hypothetical protein ENF70_07685 [Deltaproteobacteria bacterium]|nr:hypothetical protein [Deltaproteobacteria bacterium]HDH98993.1 hypothetical protein [Deltaproteobacteria bacterium]